MSNIIAPDGELGYLTYFSSAARLFGQSDLKRLLEISRLKNARIGITGLLLYRDGHFLQYLEGPEDAVQATYDRIGLDTRHKNPRIVASGRLGGAFFRDGGWVTRTWPGFGRTTRKAIRSVFRRASSRRRKEIRRSG